jgi:hypothetical protein
MAGNVKLAKKAKKQKIAAVKLSLHDNESPNKPAEFLDDSTAPGATDEDVGDSIIDLESDYTETDIDSDSFASINKFKTLEINTPTNIQEKV